MNRSRHLVGVMIVLLVLRAMAGPWMPSLTATPPHSAASHHATTHPQGDATACQLQCEAAQMQALPAAFRPPALEAAREVSGWVIVPAMDHLASPGLRPPIT